MAMELVLSEPYDEPIDEGKVIFEVVDGSPK